MYNRGHLARCRTPLLLAMKASSTLGELFEVTDSSVESALVLGHCQDTGLHDKEDALEVEMAETKVPMKKFFLRFREIDIGVTDNR